MLSNTKYLYLIYALVNILPLCTHPFSCTAVPSCSFERKQAGNKNMLSKLRETSACWLCLLRLLQDSESFLPAKELLVRRLLKAFYQDRAFPLARLRTPSLPPVNDLVLLAQTTAPHPPFQSHGSMPPLAMQKGTKTSCFCNSHRV